MPTSLIGDAVVLAARRPHEVYIRSETLAATRDLTLDAGKLQLHVRPAG